MGEEQSLAMLANGLEDSTFEVRLMCLDDLPAVLNVEAASFTDPYPASAFKSLIDCQGAELPAGKRPCCCLVALDTSCRQLAGYCMWDWQEGGAARLLSVGTAARFRGRGVARLLLC